MKDFGGELQIELPNRRLYEFNGNISLSEDNGSKEPLKPDYVLLRGAKLGIYTYITCCMASGSNRQKMFKAKGP